MDQDRAKGRSGKRLPFFLGIYLALQPALAGQILRAEYDFLLDLGLVQQYRAKLYIGANRSYFDWGPARLLQPEEDGREFHWQYTTRDSMGQYNATDLESGQQYSPVADFDGTTRILREPAMTIRWEIFPETRQIGHYNCRRAYARFRGRNYEAWFTLDVPTRFGPWKLHGLPGLIVELSEGDNRLVMRLVSLRPSGRLPEFDPAGRDYIELAAYRELLNKRGNDLIRRIQTKMPRGALVEITGRQDLERFER